MNIIHIIDSEGLYGAEILILNLIRAQLEAGLIPKLLSIGKLNAGLKKIEEEAKAEGFEVIVLRFHNGPNVIGAIRILKKAIEKNADIIHSHGYKGDILMAMLPKWYRKTPVVSTLHGWTTTRRWSKMWIYERADIMALKRLEGVAAVSRSLSGSDLFKKVGISPRFIPNGLRPLSFSKEPPADIELKNNQNGKKVMNILNIGRLSHEKGVDILIDALTLLKNDDIIYRLYLVGDGKLKKQLAEQVQIAGIQERVFFLGYVNEFYRYAPFFDLYVIPSRTEGLPMSLLEIMQSGTPVVATRVGEIPFVLKNGELGELVEPEDKMVLADAIEKVSQHYNIYKEKAHKAKMVALKEYSAQTMADSYLKFYQDVIS